MLRGIVAVFVVRRDKPRCCESRFKLCGLLANDDVASLPELFAFLALRAFVACDLWEQSLQIIVAERVLREQRAPTRAHSVWIVTLHALGGRQP